MRGQNLINIRVWNKVAIAKTHWDLDNKQDKLWIRWIHTYYIKNSPITTANISAQASWMVKKIIEARATLNNTQLSTQGSICIKTIYHKILGEIPKVPWKS